MPTPKENKVANTITAQAILQKVQEKRNDPETRGIEEITSKVSQTEHDRIIASLYEKIKELNREKLDADFSALSPDPAQKKAAGEESDRLAREIAEIETEIANLKNNYRVGNQLTQLTDQLTNLRKARSEQSEELAAAQSELKFATGFDLDPETETARKLTKRASSAREAIARANANIAEIDAQIEEISQQVTDPISVALDFAPLDAAIAKLESALDDNAPQPGLPPVKNYAGMVDQIDKQIAQLRQHDFDYSMAYKDDEGLTRTLYIKDHTKPGTNPDAEKDPIHPDTAQIAALQYLKGMLLIASNIDDKAVAEKMLVEINDAFKKYNEKTKNDINEQAEETRLLVEDFAIIISNNLNVKLKKAHKQVAMARDIGLLLTPPPAVCTITSHIDEDGKETVVAELARPIKIGQPDKDSNSRTYYQRYFSSIDNKPWFQSAAKGAGLDPTTGWMTSLFRTHYHDIARYGVAAPPSARWLPTPSGSQLIDNYMVQKDGDGEIVREMDHQFVRMGITSAFEIKSEEEQKKLAQEQIKEIMRIQLQQAIANYEKTYAAILPEKPKNGLSAPGNQKPKEFFISYQTLLSPFLFEARGYSVPLLGKALHRDNNAKFVEMAKKAVEEIAEEYANQKYTSTSSKETYNLQFTHTNSAINKRADKWYSGMIRKFDETDAEALNRKFVSVADMLQAARDKKTNDEPESSIDATLSELQSYIRGGGKKPKYPEVAIDKLETFVRTTLRNPSLATEMVTRLRAAYHLRECLNNEDPYDKIPAYQRNLMKASLEACMLGAQALHLKGCKSARDRTAIAAGALRTMLIDPKTMDKPEKLMEGVMRSLKEGHHFRAMLYHNPIVKVGDVHKDLEKLLPDELKLTARRLLVFCNKFKKKKKHKENQQTIKETSADVQQQTTATKGKEGVQQANTTKEPESQPAKKTKLKERLKTIVARGKTLGKAQVARLKRVGNKIKNSPKVKKGVHATLTFFSRQLSKPAIQMQKVMEKLTRRNR